MPLTYNRRDFLVRASRAALPLALPSVLTGCLRQPRAAIPAAALAPVDLPWNPCGLPPVHVSAEREIRTVVGHRPFRPSGFRVEREAFGDTTVVHNYGHGGGGITLSWGTAKLATDLGLQGYTGQVAVLGCGVVGLTTARMAQDAGYQVTIYTKAMPPQTTSNIAGGQWSPYTVYDDARKLTAEFTRQYFAACRYAYERVQIMVSAKYGVRWMRNYSILDEAPPAPSPRSNPEDLKLADHATDGLRPERRTLVGKDNPFGTAAATQFDGLIMEPPIYLQALLTDFYIRGGKVVVREMHSTTDVQSLNEKLVFDCTGLGAKTLFSDQELTPIKGQLTFLVPQPEVTYAAMYRGTYMFSRTDGVLLGGTHDVGDYSPDIDVAAKARILSTQAELYRGMKNCQRS